MQNVNVRSVQAIRDRSNMVMFMLKQQLSLIRFWELSQAVSSGVPGLTMEMRYTAVPPSYSSEPGAKKLFDQNFMHRLEQTGFERAQGNSPWDPLPISLFERPAAK